MAEVELVAEPVSQYLYRPLTGNDVAGEVDCRVDVAQAERAAFVENAEAEATERPPPNRLGVCRRRRDRRLVVRRRASPVARLDAGVERVSQATQRRHDGRTALGERLCLSIERLEFGQQRVALLMQLEAPPWRQPAGEPKHPTVDARAETPTSAGHGSSLDQVLIRRSWRSEFRSPPEEQTSDSA
ncbi:MAG: hypothetical protein ACYDH6_08125 [Acidimicrobiales bacterium]